MFYPWISTAFSNTQSSSFYSPSDNPLDTPPPTHSNAARYPAPQDSGVSVHPGLVDTALARGYFLQLLPGVLQPLLKPLFPVILRTPASAAKTVVYAATAPEVAGQYVSDGRVHPPSKRAQDVGAACRLWDVSTVLVGWETPPELAE